MHVVFIGSVEQSGDARGRASVGAAPSRAAAPDEATRERILRGVAELGPVTAADLAERFSLTPAAVRRHLDALVEEEAVQARTEPYRRRGRGRPPRAYVLGPAGHRRMATQCDDVAASALRFIADRLGSQAVLTFARQHAKSLVARYGAVVEAAGPDPSHRAHALADALAGDGFSASIRPVGAQAHAGLQLCQGHCPLHEVAAQHPEFCEAEAEVFAELLGVHVQRLATLANGEHVCTTYIPTRDHLAAERPSSRNARDERTP